MTNRHTIAIDWGSSRFRAYLLGPSGGIIDTVESDCGILTVSGGAFEAALTREIGTWLKASSDVYLSGMITSRNGWRETPYLDTPVSGSELTAKMRSETLRPGVNLHFLPGVAQRGSAPDVMRGEELQVFGAIGPDETVTVVLPGTHSKWVHVERGRIVAFRTFMTGEIFAVLKSHSILGRLIPPGEVIISNGAFLAAVQAACSTASSGLLHDIFETRSGVLLEAFGPAEIAGRLSGVLIAHEIRGARSLPWGAGPVRLVGDPALCRQYALAFTQLEQTHEIFEGNAVLEGWRNVMGGFG
jgi:2-dehydro-3-deoxygalactonokinase